MQGLDARERMSKPDQLASKKVWREGRRRGEERSNEDEGEELEMLGYRGSLNGHTNMELLGWEEGREIYVYGD